MGKILLTIVAIRDIIREEGEDMKICRYCGGALFDIIGGFMKVCLDCFSFERMTKEEMEEVNGDTGKIVNAESVFKKTEAE